MTTFTVPPPSDEYLATLNRLALADFTALDDEDFYRDVTGDYVRAVLAVAALLDDVRPDWFRVLDLDVLDLDDMNSCVLGQLYADRTRPDGPDGFTLGYAALIRPRFADADVLQLGVCAVAPRSVWVAEVTRRRELAGDPADLTVGT